MPIRDYSVLKGRPVSGGLVSPASHGHHPPNPPHYKIRVQAGTQSMEVAVNVESRDRSQVLYHIDFAFQPANPQALADLDPGLTAIADGLGSLALDFLRQRLCPREQMQLLPLPDRHGSSQLLGAIQSVADSAHRDPAALVYAFGSAYPDGIHDIHMNQGNPHGYHDEDNGAWQDGAVLLQLPGQQRWIGIFLAFQTQSWTTDAAGNASASLQDVPPPSSR